MGQTDSKENGGKPIKVLVVGQTPPPFHGQGVMLQHLLNSNTEPIELFHVRMAFSKELHQVGRFGLSKVFHLFQIVLCIFWYRIRFGTKNLYYPPAGPNRVPMYRDWVILILTRWMFANTIFHMHASGISTLYEDLGGLSRLMFRLAYHKPEAVIRLAEGTCPDGEQFKAKREFIVPNCAEDVRANVGSTGVSIKKQNELSDATNLLYVGSVCETKGVMVLVEACHLLSDRKIDFQLRVVGGFQPAGFEAVLESRIRELNLEDRITLCGQLIGDEKNQQLAKADIFCFPSYYESEAFPCVLIEAMSFELPVVSTHWRGISAIVEDGQTGALVEVKNSTALADAIEAFVVNSDQRIAFGAAGRKRFEQHFTVAHHCTSMSNVFESVCRR